MRRGRDQGKPELVTIYWRDIPAQVIARAGGERYSAKLDDRFQTAIDGAATRAGKTSADDYIGEWREERSSCGGDLESEVERRKSELEERYPPEVLRDYVGSGGWAP